MDFTQFRPTDASSEAIKTAIEAINAATADSEPRVVAAKESRDALLLDGSQKEVAAADAALRTAREDARAIQF